MSERIPASTRERAADICAMCASGRRFATYVQDVGEWLGLSQIKRSPAHRLAWEAIVFVERTGSHHPAHNGWDRGNCAEAEALLRTGWTP